MINHGVRARIIPSVSAILDMIQVRIFSAPFSTKARQRLAIPTRPSQIVILYMSPIFSTGIHTFILDQSPAPVKIERNIKKKLARPKNHKIWYAMSARLAMMSMRVVNLIEKATPIMNPASPMRIWY